jgi:hypothetical protein
MRALILAIFLLIVPSSASAGVTHYFCNCDTSADPAETSDPNCVNGDDANDGLTPSTPKREWETARTTFNGMANASDGDGVAFCRGGYWAEDMTAGTGVIWHNENCVTGSQCRIGDYLDPRFTLTVNPPDLLGSDPEFNIAADARPHVKQTAFPINVLGVFAFYESGWFNDTRRSGNILVENIHIEGPHDGNYVNDDSEFSNGEGIQIKGDTDDLILNNMIVEGFRFAVSARDPNEGSGVCDTGGSPPPGCNVKSERNQIKNSSFFNNSHGGILGGFRDGLLEDLYMDGNGGAHQQFDHSIYISRPTSGIEIRRVEMTNSVIDHRVGSSTIGQCLGAPFVFHAGDTNAASDVLIEDNYVHETPAASGGQCYGITVNEGYGASEVFTDIIIRGNVVENAGRVAIGTGACQNCIIENNIIIDATDHSVNAIAAPMDAQFHCTKDDDAPQTNTIIRNNTIYFSEGSSGSNKNGIVLGQAYDSDCNGTPAGSPSGYDSFDVGTNATVVSNVIYNASTSSTVNCFLHYIESGDFSAFNALDNNFCFDEDHTEVWSAAISTAQGPTSDGYTLSTFQAADSSQWGQESSNADPGLADADGEVRDDLDLSAASGTSAMVNAGHPTLSAPTAFGNVTRGGAPYDSGAYEEPTNALSTPDWEANATSAVGMNLEWNRWENPRVTFVNAMKSARRWQKSDTTCFDEDGDYAGTIDSNGYPTELSGINCVFTSFFSGAYSDGAWPTGQWVLLWDGDATFSVTGAASEYTVTEAGRATFTVDETTGGFDLAITSIPTSVSNMRLYPPGGACARTPPFDFVEGSFCDTARCPDGDCPDAVSVCTYGDPFCYDLETIGGAVNQSVVPQFHPLWIQRLGQYGILRFMNWLHINHSQVVDFSEWLPESNYTWSYGHDPLGAVPLTIIARLCNDVNAACYVNIPMQATDAHITSFAESFRDNVNSWLPIYLEMSNEVWNPGFEQQDHAAAAALAADDGGATWDGADCGTAIADCANQWHAKRTFEMCALAQAAFDALGEGSRLHCVMGTRVATSATELEAKLDCDRWTAAPSGNCYTGADIDLIGVNVYLGGDADCATAQAGVEPLFLPDPQIACDFAQADVNGPKLCDGAGCSITELATALDGGTPDRNLDWGMIVYEGGSSLSDSSTQVCADLTTEADSCLVPVYTSALDTWRDRDIVDGYDLEYFIFFDNSGRLYQGAGGNLFGHRGSNEGAWPKESAIVDWESTAGNECWWPECTLPSEAASSATYFAPFFVSP